MPYKLDGNCVVKADTGETVKCHENREKALAHLRALEANVDKSFNALKFSKMMGSGMSGTDYAHQEAWDIASAANAISFIAGMAHNEINEPNDIQSLANIMTSLLEFITGEIKEMVSAAKQGGESEYEMMSTKVPAVVKEREENNLDLSYIKSLNVDLPINKLAVKYVGKNTIAHPVFVWGDSKKTDLETEFFTRESDFWDAQMGEVARPLTWEHGQDEKFSKFEENPVIGKTVKFYDDDIARWAESVINTDKQYRKYIDQFIEEKRLGYSSDSAPQYVIREKQGKATWLKMWPWFGGSLTASPCEPRMKVYTPEFIKSLGITLPDVSQVRSETWTSDLAMLDYYKTIYKIGDSK